MDVIHKVEVLTTITEEPCETLVVAETTSCSAALGPPLPSCPWSSTFLPIQDNIQTLFLFFFPLFPPHDTLDLSVNSAAR